MLIFKVKTFTRFQRREKIGDVALTKAVQSADDGLVEADLGNGLIKQRIARPGQGKSGGFRTIIAYRRKDRAVFLYGFAKSAKANLEPDELEFLARIGDRWLKASTKEIAAAVAAQEITEVTDDQEDKSK